MVADGQVMVDARQRLPGRGAYLCTDGACAARVVADRRRLLRALRVAGHEVVVDPTTLLQDWEAAAAGRAAPAA